MYPDTVDFYISCLSCISTLARGHTRVQPHPCRPQRHASDAAIMLHGLFDCARSSHYMRLMAHTCTVRHADRGVCAPASRCTHTSCETWSWDLAAHPTVHTACILVGPYESASGSRSRRSCHLVCHGVVPLSSRTANLDPWSHPIYRETLTICNLRSTRT